MNEIPITKKKPTVEARLREALTDVTVRNKILEATGWDSSMPSKILNPAQPAGITLDKLNVLLDSMGLVVVDRKYIDYLSFGNQIGTACECARAGYDACGIVR